MSTNTHEQSKTCTEIVNGVTWYQSVLRALQNALVDAKHAGGNFRTVSACRQAREDALATEGEVTCLLAEAAQRLDMPRHPGAAAAAATLQGIGWTYTVGHERWDHPANYGKDPGVNASQQLRDLGWMWSDSLAKWLEPAPSHHAARASAAEKLLAVLGYEWAPKCQEWVCTKPWPAARGEVPGGDLPDWPADAASFRERAMYQRGVSDGRCVGKHARAVDTLEREGCVWDEGAQVWQQLKPAPTGWNAEECREAAMSVLREARGSTYPHALQAALTRLGAAVQREQ